MGDLDTATWIEAARSYRRLRRRYWRCFLGMPALLLFVFAPTYALGDELPRIVRGVLFSLFGFGWVAYWVRSVATSVELWVFRCPRCGRRFAWTWWNSWPSDRCKHCGLDLGPAALAAAKPAATADLLE